MHDLTNVAIWETKPSFTKPEFSDTGLAVDQIAGFHQTLQSQIYEVWRRKIENDSYDFV